ncbi:T9SS type A sorting domain-containing protein [bacterium]|nr:T9SS type A sorting domain-containing protein [bacterium]
MKGIWMAIITALIPLTAMCQIQQEWSVQQDFFEKGILYFDYNNDDSIELTKLYANNVSVYDGANEYSLLWSVTEDNYEFLTIWDLYTLDLANEQALFIAYNYYTGLNFEVQVYDLFADAPAWTTTPWEGEIAFIDAKNVDDDPQLEIVYGANQYQEFNENYVSSFVVYDGQDGTRDYQSQQFTGYMSGPYLGDIDNDNVVEIVCNIYDYSDSTSTLYAFGFMENGVLENQPLQPRDVEIKQNFPNPFNPSTTIPIVLRKSAQVKIVVRDIEGRQVTKIIEGQLGSGNHQFTWNGLTADGNHPASGIYFYEIEVDGHRMRRPMVLIK